MIPLRRRDRELRAFAESLRLVTQDGGLQQTLCRHLRLPEREHVRLGAGLEERDLQGPLTDRVVLTHELVQAAVPEQAVPVFVDVDAV